jgi:hypothetical protein
MQPNNANAKKTNVSVNPNCSNQRSAEDEALLTIVVGTITKEVDPDRYPQPTIASVTMAMMPRGIL